MTPTQIVGALSVLVCASACGGRSVDLDRQMTTNTSGDAAGVTLPPKTVLDERVYSFWVDDSRLYWQAYLGAVKSCIKEDCEHTRVSYGTPWSGVAIGGHDVYWIPDAPLQSVVFSCPSSGCSGEPRTFLHDPNNVAVTDGADGDYFYWNSAFDIYRCPSTGCAATPELVAADEIVSNTFGATFTFQGEYVYWPKVRSADDQGVLEIQILRAPKNGSTPPEHVLPPSGSAVTTQAGFPTFGPAFAVGSKNIYWVDSDAHILSCPVEGCGDSIPNELVSGSDLKSDLRVDDAGLYWTEANGAVSPGRVSQALHFCAFARCALGDSTVVIDKPVFQYELNGQFIYWAETADDDIGYPRRVERIPKPAP